MTQVPVRQDVIDEILAGDPVLLPAEAAAQLGVDTDMLADLAVSGAITSVQVAPRGARRYRQSAVTAYKDTAGG